MATASDLATLAAVKSWLGIKDTASDATLGPLITAASRMIYSTISRGSILPATFTDVLDGKGYPQNRLYPTRYPVVSVSALMVNGTAIPAAPVGVAQQSGWLLEPWDGIPPGGVQAIDVFGYDIPPGRQNIRITCVCGYQVSGEAATVSSSGGAYVANVLQPFGPWASDAGVVYAATGIALTAVTTTPTLAGQYQLDPNMPGQYLFSIADVGSNMLVSYGFVPQDLSQVCTELVAERWKYRDRIGQVSKSLGGQETVSYSQKSMSDTQMLMIAPFKRVVPFW